MKLIEIPVRANGYTFQAALDSGCTTNIIHSSLAANLRIKPHPNTSTPVTQLDGSTMSDGRQRLTLTIGYITRSVDVLIHRNAPHPFLIGHITGSLFKLDINLVLNQVFQLLPDNRWIALNSHPSSHSTLTALEERETHTQMSQDRSMDSYPEHGPQLTYTHKISVDPQPITDSIVATNAATVATHNSTHVASNPVSVATHNTSPVPTNEASVATDVKTIPTIVATTSKAPFTTNAGVTTNPAFVATANSPSTLSHVSTISKPISEQHNYAIISLLEEYKTLFSQSENDIGRIKGAEHFIRLKENSRPIARRPYRHSIADLTEIRRQVSALLAKGLIRESNSPYAFPCTLAGKSDGTKRLCCDYRPVNADTIDEREPLPIVQDVIDQLATAKIFTTLDMAWGYWQIAMHPDSIEKTAFITPDGHYEWLVLPFGLKNAPPTFQRTIRRVLGNLVNHGVIPYLDDIIIYAENEQEHLTLLRGVFNRLLNANIKLRLEKCRFAQHEVEYLGFVVSHGQQKPSPSKTAALDNFPAPTDVKSLQRFLGLANWFRRFVHNFSKIAEPLTRLTRKGVDWQWTLIEQNSFETIKRALTSSPVIAIYRPDKPVSLHTDACKIGIGAILMQPDDEGNNRVVAYYSRRLNCHEERYATWEQEVLAVVESMEHFHVYVHGKHTDIYSDHKALKWLHDIKKPSSRLFRWSVRLSVYSYTIHHRSGSKNEAADAFSRAPMALFVATDELKKAQSESDTSHIRKLESHDGLLYNQYRSLKRLYVPPQLQQKLLNHYHDTHGHPGIVKTLKLIISRYWWPTATEDITKYVKTCRTCQMVKTFHQPKLGKLHPPPTPEKPFDTWAIDTIVMGTAANKTKAKYIQLIIDHHSRYVWAYATPKNTTATIINILTQLFTALGQTPKTLVTDNFLNFTGKQFKRFLETHNIKQNLCSPYHPQSNGVCEKANDTIIRGLRLAILDNPRLKWSTLLPKVVENYNKTPHSATGYTPTFIHFHKDDAFFPTFATKQNFSTIAPKVATKPNVSTQDTNVATTDNQVSIPDPILATTPMVPTVDTVATPNFNLAHLSAVQRSDAAKAKRKQAHDIRHISSNFLEGDLVLRKLPDNHPSRNKLSPANTGPYVVRRQVGPETYRISPESDGSSIYTAHASQLIRFHPRVETNSAGGVRRSAPLALHSMGEP